MAFLLIIDTALDRATTGFANGDTILAAKESSDQKNHAAFIQQSIAQLAAGHSITLQNIDAIAVVNGPGSYTGLRVGLASAKGLCYSLGKPLLLLNTLEVLAQAALVNNAGAMQDTLYCPMIDARRMEVFTAVYDYQLQVIASPGARVMPDEKFINQLAHRNVVFNGNGYDKCKHFFTHTNAHYAGNFYTIKEINKLAQFLFNQKNFTDLAYSEPFYLKDFYSLTT